MKKKSIILCSFAIIIFILLGGSVGYYYKYIHKNQDGNVSENNDNKIKDNTQKVNNDESKNKELQVGAVNTNVSDEEKKKAELKKEYEEGYNAYANKQYDTAIAIENKVIAQDPNYYEAYNIKGIAQCFLHNFDEGISNINKALSIKPDFAYGRFNMALGYELNGKYNTAIEWYNKALELQKYEWSYYGIASIYGRRGDVENSVKYLKLAIDIKPAIKETAKEEEDFDPVKNSKKFKELVNN